MNARKVLTSKFVLLVGVAAVLALSAGETLAGRPNAGGRDHAVRTYTVTPSQGHSVVWITQSSTAYRPAAIARPAPWNRSVIAARPVPYRLRTSAYGNQSFRRPDGRSRFVRNSRSFGSGGAGLTITIRIGG